MRKLLFSLLMLLAPTTALAAQEPYWSKITSSNFLVSPSTAHAQFFDQKSTGIIYGSSTPSSYGEVVSKGISIEAETLRSTKKPRGRIYRFFHPGQERIWKGIHPDLREKIEAIQ
jgi:hypothetical protein